MQMLKKSLWLLLIIPVVLIILLIDQQSHAKTAAILAAYGEEQFIASDMSPYLLELKQASGLSDLTVIPIFEYDLKEDYEQDNKRLFLNCKFQFISNEIDNYYTESMHSESAEKLAVILKNLKDKYFEYAVFAYDHKDGTVLVKITNGYSSRLSVSTSSGRTYEFSFYVGYDSIEIDGNIVYSENSSTKVSAVTTETVATELPSKSQKITWVSLATNLGELAKSSFSEYSPTYWVSDSGVYITVTFPATYSQILSAIQTSNGEENYKKMRKAYKDATDAAWNLCINEGFSDIAVYCLEMISSDLSMVLRYYNGNCTYDLSSQ